MSYDEIARMLGRSLASVNSLIYRARIAVRHSMGQARQRGLL